MTRETKNLPALRFPEFSAAPPWETKTLGEVCEIINGGTPSTSDDSYWGGDVPWITPAEMGKTIDPYVSITRRTITESGLKKSGKLFPPNSVILSVRAPIGHLAINNVPMATNQGCSGFIPSGYINYKFLFYFLFMSKSELNLAGAGSTFTEISVKSLRSFLIPLPSLPEQEKIAACLWSLDEVMIGQSAKLDSLRDYKKGLLQQLFPTEGEAVPRLRFPEFATAAPWETKKLGDVATLFRGKGLSKSDISTSGKTPCIHYGELFTLYREVISEVHSYTNLSDDFIYSIVNDVLMPSSDVTPKGLAKASCIKIDNVILGSDILVIRPDNNLVSGTYLSFYIRFNENQVLKIVSGSTVFHLYANDMRKFGVPLPTLPEQEKIADCLSSLEDQITAASEQLATLKSHKKGLMQQLFPNLEGFQGSALAGSRAAP